MFRAVLAISLLCILQVSGEYLNDFDNLAVMKMTDKEKAEMKKKLDERKKEQEREENAKIKIKTDDPKFLKLLHNYIHKDKEAWLNYTSNHLDEQMNKLKITLLYKFKKEHPKEDWKAFFKVAAIKKNRVTAYYTGKLERTYVDLEQKLFEFTAKSIKKVEGKEMSDHKAKFWIKSSIELFNKYAEQVYNEIYFQCQETYFATMMMHIEDTYPSQEALIY